MSDTAELTRDELRAEVARLQALLTGEAMLKPATDGSLFAIEHWAVRFIADSLGKTLADAPNYMQMAVTHPEHGELIVTVRRKHGKTPEEKARVEVARLQAAIREHRDQKGDDRCWQDDENLYRCLPEGYTPPTRDTSVELENCRRYIACRQHPQTEYISPQREIDRLREALLTVAGLAGGNLVLGQVVAQALGLSEEELAGRVGEQP